MKSATHKLYLARHGETAWSITGQHTGLTDLPLTPVGECDSRNLGARLEGMNFAKVFTSPLQRARRSCELAGLAPLAEVDPDLMEWDYGEYEGLRTTEILAMRPGWNLFRDGCPGGESPEAVIARVHRVLHRVHTAGGDVLLFASGHFFRMLATRWIGAEPTVGGSLLLGPASLSALGYEARVICPSIGEGAIHFWNDNGHVLSAKEHESCRDHGSVAGPDPAEKATSAK
jgi:broad specificity phosphatase PhoE